MRLHRLQHYARCADRALEGGGRKMRFPTGHDVAFKPLVSLEIDMDTQRNNGQLAVITGASSGIGRELARCCAQNGYDLLIAADEPQIDAVAAELASYGVKAESV